MQSKDLFLLGIHCRTNNRKLALFQRGRAYKLESWRWKQQPWEAVRLLGGGIKHYIGRDFPFGVQHWTKSPYYSWLKLVYSSTGALLPLSGLENSLGSSLLPPCLTVCKQVHPDKQNIVITLVTTHWELLLIGCFLKCFTFAKLISRTNCCDLDFWLVCFVFHYCD